MKNYSLTGYLFFVFIINFNIIKSVRSIDLKPDGTAYTYFSHGNVLFEIAKTAKQMLQSENTKFFSENLTNTTTTCLLELSTFYSELLNNSLWSFKMLDASGNFVPAAFVWGNNYMLGSKQACSTIDAYTSDIDLPLSSRYKRLTDPNLLHSKPPFATGFIMIYARHSSRLQFDMKIYQKNILHFGVCVPKSCKAEAILKLFNISLEIEDHSSPLNVFNSSVLAAKQLELRPDFKQNPAIIVLFLIFTIMKIFITTATYLDKKCSKIPKFVAAFSSKRNLEKLLTPPGKNERLVLIHGLKTVSMIWIITGHVTFFSMASIKNLPILLTFMDKIMYQPVLASPTAVDTFFTITGFLLGYSFYKEIKVQCITGWRALTMIFYRILRFVPSYTVLILQTYVASMYLNDVSPYWMIENNETNCRLYWWRNLLFVNNWFSTAQMCMSWSWYLAVDLQCFVLGIFLLIFYSRFRIQALATGFAIIMYCLHGITVEAVVTKYALSLDVQYEYLDQFYTSTKGRVYVYLVGIVAGYFFATQNNQLKTPTVISKFLTTCAFCFIPALIYSQMIRTDLNFYGPFMVGFGRLLWAFSISWIIMSCSTDSSSFLNRILSKQIFVTLSRLTFGAYLINPIVILFISMQVEEPITLGVINTTISMFGYIIITYIAAFGFKIMIEDPVNNVVKLILGKEKKDRKQTTAEDKNNNNH